LPRRGERQLEAGRRGDQLLRSDVAGVRPGRGHERVAPDHCGDVSTRNGDDFDRRDAAGSGDAVSAANRVDQPRQSIDEPGVLIPHHCCIGTGCSPSGAIRSIDPPPIGAAATRRSVSPADVCADYLRGSGQEADIEFVLSHLDDISEVAVYNGQQVSLLPAAELGNVALAAEAT